MKKILLLPLLLVSLLASCGPSESELHSELQAIEREMIAIQTTMRQYRSQMNQAEVEAFFGSFAAGYGTTTGDYGLAGEGISATNDAIRNYDHSASSLEQLKQRYYALNERRMVIIQKLE